MSSNVREQSFDFVAGLGLMGFLHLAAAAACRLRSAQQLEAR